MKECKTNDYFDLIMSKAIQNQSLFYIWKSLNGSVQKINAHIVNYQKSYRLIEIGIETSMMANFFDLFPGEKILSLYSPVLGISFKVPVKNINDKNQIKCDIPSEYIVHNRRGHERVVPLCATGIKIKKNGNYIKKTVFDISESGVSILLSKSEKVLIGENQSKYELVLELGSKSILLNAELVRIINIDRYKLDSHPYGGVKFTFRFVDIKQEDRDTIKNYFVNEKLLAQLKWTKL